MDCGEASRGFFYLYFSAFKERKVDLATNMMKKNIVDLLMRRLRALDKKQNKPKRSNIVDQLLKNKKIALKNAHAINQLKKMYAPTKTKPKKVSHNTRTSFVQRSGEYGTIAQSFRKIANKNLALSMKKDFCRF